MSSLSNTQRAHVYAQAYAEAYVKAMENQEGQATKQPAKQVVKPHAKQAAKQPAKQAVKPHAKQAAKQPAKQAAKHPAEQPAKQTTYREDEYAVFRSAEEPDQAQLCEIFGDVNVIPTTSRKGKSFYVIDPNGGDADHWSSLYKMCSIKKCIMVGTVKVFIPPEEFGKAKTFIKNHPLVTDVQASEQAEEQAQEQAAEQVEEQQIEFPSVIPVKFTIPNSVSTGSITYTLSTEIAHGIVDDISFSPDDALKPGFKYAMVTLLTENVEQGTTGFKLIQTLHAKNQLSLKFKNKWGKSSHYFLKVDQPTVMDESEDESEDDESDIQPAERKNWDESSDEEED
jgi:hypothetical protein